MKFIVLCLFSIGVVTSPFSVAKLNNLLPKSQYASHTPYKSAALKIANKEQAAKLVKSRMGGKVLSVKTVKGKQAYKVKLLKDDGHIISVYVNAKTGKIKG
ncbi:PepSY domain-containing protein [Thalassotalea psychrophila]|uniref:PepSY domain-containing protein n=1 Tax=Thalassotalea psychrophila TaxID=3065647 RepID=A0ABY9TU53_9GAMM|nr:PepSY domain-containing protein [Colwelliaceae bacterium SQ149]